MDLGLKGKVALVLASSKGLGKATALQLGLEGAKIMLASRSQNQLANTAEEIKDKTKAEVNYCVCDVTKEKQIKSLVDETIAVYGAVDILINNAGGPPAGNFDSFSDQDWQQAYELNLLSYIRAIREVLPYMRKKSGGHIINFASSSIKQPIDNLILSNTFRMAVMGLAKSLSQELAADNILVNTVGPGRIATGRLEDLDRKKAKNLNLNIEDVRKRSEQEIPLGRYGTPEEFAKAVVFLCSSANTFITGQNLLIDGGLVKSF